MSMDKSYVRIIQAIILAAAVLGLLLTTPSLEAKTHKKSKHKKMKIVFDGNESAAPRGELGDEVAQPRSGLRSLAEPNSVVRLRGSSIDALWEKSKTASRAKPKVNDAEENPDLMEPMGAVQIETPASSRSNNTASLLEAKTSVDESALSTFKKSKKKSSRKKQLIAKTDRPAKLPLKSVARRESPVVTSKPTVSLQTRAAELPPVTLTATADTIQPLPEPIMEFEDVKSKITSTRPVTRTLPNRSSSRSSRPVSSNSLATRVSSIEPSDFKFNFAFENTTSLGRKYELETAGGRNFMMKNEFFIGTSHSSSWGAKVSAAYVSTSNDDSKKDVREMGDPSVIIVHPSIYKSRDINIFGQVRYFVPIAETSRTASLQQFAYYLTADAQLVEQLTLTNTFAPRFYYQAAYADTDAFSLLFDSTEISRRFDWFRAGLGQRTQIESHEVVAPGTSAELYPFADFLGLPNTILEAKVYVPILVNGLVNGAPGAPMGPTAAGFSNLQAEFFARISF
jgi:hypothetical protein